MWRGRSPLMLAVMMTGCVSVAAFARVVVLNPAKSKQPHASLAIRGSATQLLFPGSSQTLDLRLRNRRSIPLLVTGLRVRVRVDRAHRRAGCTRRDYRVRQMNPLAFPIELAPHTVTTLSRLQAVEYPRLEIYPRLEMVYSASRNQDACKGAKLKLRYRAQVTRAR